jgi:hypothetical protein
LRKQRIRQRKTYTGRNSEKDYMNCLSRTAGGGMMISPDFIREAGCQVITQGNLKLKIRKCGCCGVDIVVPDYPPSMFIFSDDHENRLLGTVCPSCGGTKNDVPLPFCSNEHWGWLRFAQPIKLENLTAKGILQYSYPNGPVQGPRTGYTPGDQEGGWYRCYSIYIPPEQESSRDWWDFDIAGGNRGDAPANIPARNWAIRHIEEVIRKIPRSRLGWMVFFEEL